jgi:hypothetical protein
LRRSGFVVLLALALGAPVRGADPNTLLGIHFWGDRNDSAPATLLDSNARGGYSLEIINTHNPEWNDVDVADPLYQNFKNAYNITPITRLGQYWGKTVPAPGTPEYNTWPSYIANNVVNRLKNTAHLWQLGNEANLQGEATNWPNQQIMPGDYATLYRNVRTAVKAPAVTGTAGVHQLLVAPPSPGGVIPGVRWMDGSQWLSQTLAAIPVNEIDGVSLHSYGGGGSARQATQDFRKGLIDQIAAIDADPRGLKHLPLYITEWNRGAQIGNLADEAISAEFARRAFKFLDRWNRTPGNHNIVTSTWFVYDGGNGTGAWDVYSIEYWKNNGNPTNSPSSLYNAFFTTARAGYKAGIAGTKPIPGGVRIFDDFEATNGHFANAGFSNSAGTTGVNPNNSFKVSQNDTDSYSKFHAQKIGIADDTTNANGWYLRYLYAGGSPSADSQTQLTNGIDGFIGFYLRLFTVNGSENLSGAGPLSVQLILDSDGGGGANSDAGKPLSVIADGEWHLYEWNLDNPSDWVPWSIVAASDGKLGTAGSGDSGVVTIDSIIFQGGNVNVEYLLDTVGHNQFGSMNVMQGLPEPASALSLLAIGLLAIRRNQRASR